MNIEQAWQYAISEQPEALARAAAACKILDYSKYTLTILAPDQTTARLVDCPTMQTAVENALMLNGLGFRLVVQVDQASSEDRLSEFWNNTLAELQAETARASYDTWVRDTQVVKFEGDILTVAARNAYARDWLSERIRPRACQLVSQKLSRNVQVYFVVGAGKVEPEQPASEDDDVDADAEREDEPEPRKGFELQPVDQTAYEAIVHPDKVVVLPGYALRLLQQGDLTPKDMSLWVAFRQAVYSSWKRGKGATKNIPYWEVLRFAMMSKPSYFREVVGKTSIAGGLVEEVPAEYTQGLADPRFDNARRYQVNMAPRLTRRDCAAIEAALTGPVAMTGTIPEALEVAEKTLRLLTAQSPSEYLDNSNTKAVSQIWHRGVVDIVRYVIGLKQGSMPDSLYDAAEALQNHIVNAYGKVVITHYFLQKAAPKMGLSHAQAWAIIALRDRCWYDHVTGEQHQLAVLPGGLDELAGMVGTSVKSVRRWLDDPAFRMFVGIQNTDGVELPEAWGSRVVIFDVSPTEPTQEEWDKVINALGQNDKQAGTKRYTSRDKMSNGQGQSDKRVGTKRYTDWDKVINGLGQNDKRLNNLIKPHINPNNPQESPPPPRQKSARMAGVGSRAFWDWDFLIGNNAIGQASSSKLLAANKQAGHEISRLCQNLVSWILYAYSYSGRGVQNPVSNAIARLRENLFSGAGGDFDRLAALQPHELKTLFDIDLAGRDLPGTVAADLYVFHFDNLPEDHKRELYRRLFG